MDLQLEGVVATRRSGARVFTLGPIDFTLAAGECVAVVGPSGCGKSTLLRLASGLITPTRGRALFRGRDLGRLGDGARAKLRRREFAFVFQDGMLMDGLDVSENVVLQATIDGRVLEHDVVRASLGSVRLAGLGQSAVDELSGGEQQRVAIARALALQAAVVFADEPTGALDPVARDEVVRALLQVPERGHAHMMATHDPEVAARADRVLLMRAGQVEAQFGPLRPHDVAELLGVRG